MRKFGAVLLLGILIFGVIEAGCVGKDTPTSTSPTSTASESTSPSSSASPAPAKVYKMSVVVRPNSPWGQAAKMLAADVATRTNGRVKI